MFCSPMANRLLLRTVRPRVLCKTSAFEHIKSPTSTCCNRKVARRGICAGPIQLMPLPLSRLPLDLMANFMTQPFPLRCRIARPSAACPITTAARPLTTNPTLSAGRSTRACHPPTSLTLMCSTCRRKVRRISWSNRTCSSFRLTTFKLSSTDSMSRRTPRKLMLFSLARGNMLTTNKPRRLRPKAGTFLLNPPMTRRLTLQHTFRPHNTRQLMLLSVNSSLRPRNRTKVRNSRVFCGVARHRPLRSLHPRQVARTIHRHLRQAWSFLTARIFEAAPRILRL